MRINKKDPTHWYYLICSGVNVFISIPFRFIPRRGNHKRVVFYDQMNGNSKVFAEYLSDNAPEIELYYCAFPPYHRVYKVDQTKIKKLSPLKLTDMIKVARSDAVITGYGIQTLVYYVKLTSIKFVNVWHGIGFRNHTAEEFKYFKGYTEAWVTSPAFKKLYERWGWPGEKIKILGYARTDPLVNKSYSRKLLMGKYKVQKNYAKIILFAPTWHQEDGSHNQLPFNEREESFLTRLNALAKKQNSLVLFRPHLHSEGPSATKRLSNVKLVPATKYPETSEILFLADILISDWSSILFDYLILERPTIFLDVPSPYHDRTINEEYRYGKIVGNVDQMLDAVDKYINNPRLYNSEFSNKIRAAKKYMWSNTVDGKTTRRYYERLNELLELGKSR